MGIKSNDIKEDMTGVLTNGWRFTMADNMTGHDYLVFPPAHYLQFTRSIQDYGTSIRTR